MTAAAIAVAVIPEALPCVNPMNDHHFSYPHVVPLVGVTISGHSGEQSEPIDPHPVALPLDPPVRLAGAESAPTQSLFASVAA